VRYRERVGSSLVWAERHGTLVFCVGFVVGTLLLALVGWLVPT
jgi:hypothetical protein